MPDMAAQPLRIGIVGAGGNTRLRHIPGFRALKGVEIVGVVNSTPESTDRVARADARAISNEMHGGFQPLRQGCPMNLGARYRTPEITEGMKANIDRIEDIWSATRARLLIRSRAAEC